MSSVALVTGAGQGNGRAIAMRLAADGYRVVVNDLTLELAAKTIAEISGKGGKASPMPGDVADIAATQKLVTQVVQEFGQLDVLVNNAGIIRANPFGQVTEQEWDLTFGINVRGLFFLMQAAAKVMLPRRTGAIVNIASIAGRGAPTLSPAYAASKAAVINLSQSAARALASSGIRVNAVC